MPWSRPAARMREMVLAIRAIWATWQDGTPLRFEGEFYRHTLMTPFFTPEPSGLGPARIFLAGVGDGMTEVAGEVADGFLVHPFSTAEFLREHTLPALERGLATSGRTRADIEISWPVMVVTGTTDEDLDAAAAVTRAQLAFYGSTPAYKVVLDAHGWGDLQPELNRLSKEGRWDVMASMIDDEMLDTFAVRRAPERDRADDAPHATATSSTGSRSMRRTAPIRPRGRRRSRVSAPHDPAADRHRGRARRAAARRHGDRTDAGVRRRRAGRRRPRALAPAQGLDRARAARPTCSARSTRPAGC